MKCFGICQATIDIIPILIVFNYLNFVLQFYFLLAPEDIYHHHLSATFTQSHVIEAQLITDSRL